MEDILNVIIENQLTVDEYYLLNLVFHNKKEISTYLNYINNIKSGTIDISSLETRGFLKVIDTEDGEALFLRTKGVELFSSTKEKVDDWIEEWMLLFPSGIKSGGKYLRSDKTTCLSKMKSFVKKYKYSKEDILAATQSYLEDRKRDGWKYTVCAVYFIDKTGSGSALADWIQNKDAEIKIEYKENQFEKEIE